MSLDSRGFRTCAIVLLCGLYFIIWPPSQCEAAPSDKPLAISPRMFEPPKDGSAQSIEQYFGQFEGSSLAACLEEAARGNSDAHYCAATKMRSVKAGNSNPSYIAHLRAAAEAGNFLAENDLGHAYLNGKGVPKDSELAYGWFSKAAAKGMPHAMVSLGWMHMCGLGVPVDFDKARYWNRLSVDWDHAEGANNLGWLYEHGLGGAQDLEAARHWYAKGAEWGSALAAVRAEALSVSPEFQRPNESECEG